MLEELSVRLQERAEFGKKNYGTYLSFRNGRNPLVDAFQEVLDLIMYLRQVMSEYQDEHEYKDGYAFTPQPKPSENHIVADNVILHVINDLKVGNLESRYLGNPYVDMYADALWMAERLRKHIEIGVKRGKFK